MCIHNHQSPSEPTSIANIWSKIQSIPIIMHKCIRTKSDFNPVSQHETNCRRIKLQVFKAAFSRYRFEESLFLNNWFFMLVKNVFKLYANYYYYNKH
jgi:hypothetical protein